MSNFAEAQLNDLTARLTEPAVIRSRERAAALECLMDRGRLPGASLRETLMTHLGTVDRLYPSRVAPVTRAFEKEEIKALMHTAMTTAVEDYRRYGSVNYAAILKDLMGE